jgi:hypothetical protein
VSFRTPKVGEVWTSRADRLVKLTVTEVREDVNSAQWGHVRFDQNTPGDDLVVNFTDTLRAFLDEAEPPAEPTIQVETPAEAVAVVPAPEPAGKTVNQLLAEMTPSEKAAADRAARTAQTLYEMLRLTRPSIFEAINCCATLLIQVAEDCCVDMADVTALLKNTHSRLVQHQAEQAAERAVQAS